MSGDPSDLEQGGGSGRAAAQRTGIFAAPKQDSLASVVVFLVALPLCMGIALASGVPVSAGLITGIIGGLVVGFLAGAPLQVSGPAAGLTVIVYDVVQRHGLETLGIVVLIGGVLQLLAGLFKLGQWFRAVSPAVVQGMLAGIGVLILCSQFHVMVDDSPKENGVQNLITIPGAIQRGLPWPTWHSRSERTRRTQLLKQFGDLHEQQMLVRAAAGKPEATRALAASDIDKLLARQETLLVELKRLAIIAAEDPVVELQDAVHTALATSRAAIVQLEGRDTPAIQKSLRAAEVSVKEVLNRLKDHAWAAKIGILTIAILVLFPMLVPPRLRFIPAPLVAIVGATIVAASLALPVLYVEVPDSLWSEVRFPTLSILTTVPTMELLKLGAVVAIVASAETLLCATAVDQMQSGTRTDYDRELTAQGVGNMVCGVVGAIPMTGVIVRSAANVQAGGQTRLSAILHGLWLLIFVAFLAFLLRLIPTAGLAAMLVYTGYKLVNPKAIRKLWAYGKGEVAIYLVTVITIVATDLLTGVVVGIIISAGKLLYVFSHLKTRLAVDPGSNKCVLHVEGAATFVRLPQLARDLERVPDKAELHVDFEHLDYIDHACLDLLMNWAKQHESTGGELVIDWESLHANFHRTLGRNGKKA